MILYGFSTHLLIELLPDTLGILKIPSALYIFYFAYKIAKSKPQDLESNSNNDSLGFFNAFFLQLINVKIILYVITIHISFVLPYYQSLFYTSSFVLYSIIIGYCGMAFVGYCKYWVKKLFSKAL